MEPGRGSENIHPTGESRNMTSQSSKTKACVEPWRAMQFDAAGNIIPCCSGTIRGEFGNINDYFEAVEAGSRADLFVTADYRSLREGLLTGELFPACKSCRVIQEDDITTDELRKRVVGHLENQGIRTQDADLTGEWAFTEAGGNVTNKCSFSCIYCSHSGEDGHSGYFLAELDRGRFLGLLDLLYRRGLRVFNFAGIGELTSYPGWQELCEAIMDRFPELRLHAVSNFGRKFSDSELDTLARLDLLLVSCDTLDESTYARLRKGGRLPVLLDNVMRIRSRFSGDPSLGPKLAFNITVSDAIVDKLESLFRFAAENGMFVQLSPLFEMSGSIASRTGSLRKLTEVPSAQILGVREVFYDLPRRLKAENPIVGVWEYMFLYRCLMKKADEISLNLFVPGPEEFIYNLFSVQHQKNPNAYLRKFWVSFDEVFKGIYLRRGRSITLDLSQAGGHMTYRAIWCHQRADRNLEITLGPVESATVSGRLTLSAAECDVGDDGVLFEVISFRSGANEGGGESRLALSPLEGAEASMLVREAYFAGNEGEHPAIGPLVASQEPIVIWCAGFKTLKMLSTTSLGQANIKMIIDMDPLKTGQLFCGRVVYAAEAIGDFSGKIVVINASCPERVELDIRKMGIANEILVL